MPNLFVIAGPNGAGKSTAAPLLIGERLGIREFVNADGIAAGLSAFAPERVALEAGRIMLRRLDSLASAGADFAFETTLATRSFAPWIARLRAERGYRFHLAFLWLPSAEMAVMRVAGRVRHGGHAVPERDIKRRYDRGLRNFFDLYRPIADSWEMHDNSSLPHVRIATSTPDGEIEVANPALWHRIEGSMRASESESTYGTAAGPQLMGVPIGEVMAIFDRAGREAIARHRALGIPVVVWRDGRPVEVPAEELGG